ncbi:Ump1p NDAI_0C05780 [Naumovozyma dairenensis CBS 421]|uniref:Proteasome maturation factor UMP1 n=1 Tax=Naumovozyma dairenensis (strain ATCC 10597 / BCRC 20456 / CBS 421 / NBRC 0211 / NRRL Y-12639) TaxID=1071378 RepID=G0W8X6_NAUDC|nr:hypothetical protein NDAI_0C05780 [Naumovozyma dairenensis CBS 421]CCD24237.1 hypothetical protein NDAI_0C05780 [Naumovozyma dairenensis CBS 421]
MNVAPKSDFKSTISTADGKKITSNATHGALPDTLRLQEGGAVPISSELNDRHPLESRLKNWDVNEHERALEQYRQIFGIAEPLRREMELSIVEKTDFNPLNSNSMHRDILLNKDTSVDWEDVYPGGRMASGMMIGNDIHNQIERKTGI